MAYIPTYQRAYALFHQFFINIYPSGFFTNLSGLQNQHLLDEFLNSVIDIYAGRYNLAASRVNLFGIKDFLNGRNTINYPVRPIVTNAIIQSEINSSFLESFIPIVNGFLDG